MVVLIFGATGGVGSAVARQLVADGTSVHLSGRSESRLRSLGEALSSATSQADALAEGALERAVADAGEQIGGLVYAVGSVTLKPLGRTTDADILRDFQLNALGAARAVRAAFQRSSGPATHRLSCFRRLRPGAALPSTAPSRWPRAPWKP